MKYRRLGQSDIQVSPLSLGTVMWGAEVDEQAATRLAARAREAGVNFIDTAEAYGGGVSEQVVGRVIKEDRHVWVLGTKVGRGKDADGPSLSRQKIIQAAETSLKRLGTDHIDIYYFHREDRRTPVSESILGIADLIRQGKIRHFGICNHYAWRIAEICKLCDELSIARPVVSQQNYNIVNRQAEVEHIPACSHFGLGVMPFSPLARGILTGKYLPGSAPPEGSRAARGDRRILLSEWREESLKIAQELKSYAEGRGLTAGQFAVNWLLNNRSVSSVIAGPRTMQQWDDYLRALDFNFTAADEALVDRLVATGHCSTPGFNDPEYPIEGRQTFVALGQG